MALVEELLTARGEEAQSQAKSMLDKATYKKSLFLEKRK
jgi:hypothetical protein